MFDEKALVRRIWVPDNLRIRELPDINLILPNQAESAQKNALREAEYKRLKCRKYPSLALLPRDRPWYWSGTYHWTCYRYVPKYKQGRSVTLDLCQYFNEELVAHFHEQKKWRTAKELEFKTWPDNYHILFADPKSAGLLNVNPFLGTPVYYGPSESKIKRRDKGKSKSRKYRKRHEDNWTYPEFPAEMLNYAYMHIMFPNEFTRDDAVDFHGEDFANQLDEFLELNSPEMIKSMHQAEIDRLNKPVDKTTPEP